MAEEILTSKCPECQSNIAKTYRGQSVIYFCTNVDCGFSEEKNIDH